MPREIDSPTITRYRGSRIDISLQIARNLSGYTATSELRANDGDGALLATFTTSISAATDKSTVILSIADSSALPLGNGQAFDVKLTHNSNPEIRTPRIWLNLIRGVTA